MENYQITIDYCDSQGFADMYSKRFVAESLGDAFLCGRTVVEQFYKEFGQDVRIKGFMIGKI